MINARERLHYYYSQGFDVERGFDRAGVEHEWHDCERTTLYTIAGSLLLERAGQDPLLLLPGDEQVVLASEKHRGVTGESGWKYLAAYNPAEAR